jgi:hypothetical protein
LFDKNAAWNAHFEPDSLNGVELISSEVRQTRRTLADRIEFSEKEPVTLIPYYAWNNRGPGEMMVWLPLSETSANASPAPTIAFRKNGNSCLSQETPGNRSIL